MSPDPKLSEARGPSPVFRRRLLLVLLLAALGVLAGACDPADFVRIVGFQGRLLDGSGNPVNGNTSIQFTLYNASSGGFPFYTHTQTVNVTNGLFNVDIGATITENQYGLSGIDPENFAGPVFVQLTIGGEALSPRTRLSPAATAMSLIGGAIVTSGHEGDGPGGADETSASYATLSVVASNLSSGTALVVGHPSTNAGDYIRACALNSSTSRTCADVDFRVDDNGEVYADGGYHCGSDINDAASTLDEAEIATCLEDETFADFAEMMPARMEVEPGDVLAIGVDGMLYKADEAFLQTVVGVYSTRPSYLGNSRYANTEGYAPLAMVGLVPVKVTIANGAIQPGDMLVASPLPGFAMRGGANPPQGAVIGKALTGLNSTNGMIMMLVMAR